MHMLQQCYRMALKLMHGTGAHAKWIVFYFFRLACGQWRIKTLSYDIHVIASAYAANGLQGRWQNRSMASLWETGDTSRRMLPTTSPTGARMHRVYAPLWQQVVHTMCCLAVLTAESLHSNTVYTSCNPCNAIDARYARSRLLLVV
jgi:hypothetical protein